MGMKWVLEAKRRGAKVIVVDPKFNRTAAHADHFVRIRPGSDLAFTGALIRLILTEELYDREFVERHTNALFMVDPRFGFRDGLFSGFRSETLSYDPSSWAYRLGADQKPLKAARLDEPGTVFSVLREHYARYTPELAERITGVPAAQIVEVGRLFATTKPATLLYALGATQHTHGVQQIRSYAILQLLLGNMGLAGGGIAANRGESNVQGATDNAVAWNYLPGYLASPTTAQPTLADYEKSFGSTARKGLVNVLRAWFGEEAQSANDFRYEWLPRREPGVDYGLYHSLDAMRRKTLRGLIVLGENPAVSNANNALLLDALAALELLVVVDLFETETAAFFKTFDRDPAAIDTEVVLLPAATFLEKPGSITNGSRCIQWREQAVTPRGEARPDLAILDELFRRLRDRARDGGTAMEAPLLAAEWPEQLDYEQVLREIGGRFTSGARAGQPLRSTRDLAADGSTACGNPLYAGVFADENGAWRNRADARDNRDASGLGLSPGFAYTWPDNASILYNRASANATGAPRDEERPLVWWDAERGEWRGHTTPLVPDLHASPSTAAGQVAFPLAEEAGRLFVGPYAKRQPEATAPEKVSPVLKDGPLPEHYEPMEGPFENPLHASPASSSPVVSYPQFAGQKPLGKREDFPFILTTGFLHEMWGGGAMTRRMSRLVETQPGPFVEVSKELGRLRGIASGDLVRVITARGEVRVTALVTPRLKPLTVNGKLVEVVWAPMHYGPLGQAVGDSINRITLDALEPNVSIQETKACLCDVRK
jgi:formate dehydrogenase major subunit